MSKVIISSDSTCDLGSQLVERYNISIHPMIVNMDDKSYLDGVDIEPDKIYEYHKNTGKLAKTSAISIGSYGEYFDKLKAENGEDVEIVHFCISSDMSSTYSNCSIASEERSGIYPIDSQNLSTGIGLLVLHAYDMAAAGYSGKEIADEINALRSKVNVSFVIDTLHYLWKGGRCSGVAALGANVLRLKPCIEVKNGKMVVGRKFRGKLGDVLEQYVKARFEAYPNIRTNRIFITHSGTDQAIIDRVEKVVKESGHNFDEILITRAGCTVSSHCGPNTLGILFIEE